MTLGKDPSDGGLNVENGLGNATPVRD